MIAQTILNVLERRGVDSYSIATWKARLVGRHYQAILEATVVTVVVLLVLLFTGVAGAAQDQPPAAAQPVPPAEMAMKMAGMRQACQAKHEATATDVQALTKLLVEARASNDITVLRAALEATLRHFAAAAVKPQGCAGMMNQVPPAAVAPRDEPLHKH